MAKIVEKIESTPETIIPTPSPVLRAICSQDSLKKAISLPGSTTLKATVNADTSDTAIDSIPTAATNIFGTHSPHSLEKLENELSTPNKNDTPEVVDSNSVESSIADLKSNDSTFVEDEQHLDETEISKDILHSDDSEWEQVSS